MTTCGLDEAGRGPLAGPVTAACVVLGSLEGLEGLADSKTLTRARREALDVAIRSRALAWGLGSCTAQEIDRLDILRASLLAMRRAWLAMRSAYPGVAVDEALADGLFCPDVEVPCRAVVRGDASEACISAASILAKVERDRVLEALATRWPLWGFDVHKGYPTAAHRRALALHGPSPEHRLSFRWKPASPS